MGVKFAARKISRFTLKPEDRDWRNAKKMARYLRDNKKVMIEHKFHKLPERVVVRSDTDFLDASVHGDPCEREW